uniref:D-isomer specific 2-hydroxyacid dehydrogenase NAD-binding domain-containing protein n=1 Tax=Poecilia reticulata TaxID=8081 RepID=A0A3P9PP19_POERE
MPISSIFRNTSTSSLVVNQDALVKALMSGTIRAAALDGHPFLAFSNVLITPHIGTNICGTIRKMVHLFIYFSFTTHTPRFYYSHASRIKSLKHKLLNMKQDKR